MTKIFEQTKSSNQSINEFYSPIFQEVRRLIYNAFDKNYHSVDDEHYPTVEISIGVWCLLESIATLASLKQYDKRVDLGKAATQSGIDGKFLVFCLGKTYNICRNETRDESVLKTIASSCLCVIKEFAQFITTSEANEIASKLKSTLIGFQRKPIFIGRLILALVALTEQAHNGCFRQIIQNSCSDWILEIFHQCEIDLKSHTLLQNMITLRG